MRKKTAYLLYNKSIEITCWQSIKEAIFYFMYCIHQFTMFAGVGVCVVCASVHASMTVNVAPFFPIGSRSHMSSVLSIVVLMPNYPRSISMFIEITINYSFLHWHILRIDTFFIGVKLLLFRHASGVIKYRHFCYSDSKSIYIVWL